MTNPQKENGYTPIANEILEALIKQNLSGREFSIILCIIRKTYGFRKKTDKLSLSQLSRYTNIAKPHCSTLVKKLGLLKMVTVTDNGNGLTRTIGFQKDYSKWVGVTKYGNRYQKHPKRVTKNGNKGLPQVVTTKETLTKERIKKGNTKLSDQEFLKKLKENPSYKHIDIDNELNKMDAWLLTNPHRKKTRRFILGWLNRIEKPMEIKNKNSILQEVESYE